MVVASSAGEVKLPQWLDGQRSWVAMRGIQREDGGRMGLRVKGSRGLGSSQGLCGAEEKGSVVLGDR